MNFRQLFRLARINHKNYKKLSRLTLTNIVISSLILLLVLSIGSGIDEVMRGVSEQKFEEKEVQIRGFIRNGAQTISNPVNESTITNIKNQMEVHSVQVSSILDVGQSIQLDDNTMQTNQLQFVNPNFSTFRHSFLMDRQKEYGEFRAIVAGRDFSSQDKRSMIVDEALAHWLGYANPSTMIGKELLLRIGENSLQPVKVIGVHNYRLGVFANVVKKRSLSDVVIESKQMTDVMNYPGYVSHDVLADLAQATRESMETVVTVQAQKIPDVQPLVEYIRSVTNNALWYNQEGLNKLMDLMQNVQLVTLSIAVITLLVALLNMINMLVVKMIKQKKNIHIMSVLGFKKRQIVVMYIFDQLLILIKAIITYALLVFLITIAIDRLMYGSYSMLSDEITAPFVMDVSTFAIYTLLVLVVFLGAVTVIASMQMKRDVYLSSREES
jgi:ABC-type antimicrobial peptide transport system permease subunit